MNQMVLADERVRSIMEAATSVADSISNKPFHLLICISMSHATFKELIPAKEINSNIYFSTATFVPTIFGYGNNFPKTMLQVYAYSQTCNMGIKYMSLTGKPYPFFPIECDDSLKLGIVRIKTWDSNNQVWL